jgi:hypothetical protein
MAKSTTNQSNTIQIKPPNLKVAVFSILGTAPYVQARFSQKAMTQMIADQEAGAQAKSKKKRDAKDFDALCEGAKHFSDEGWLGIPAPAFRASMISACRTINFKMTLAKLSVFVEADGFDKVDGTPLVKITSGKPHRVDHAVRNATGVIDIRPRPMWDPGWTADVRIRWDADQFSIEDVTNLLSRAGMQVGVGEGRPDSRQSTGMGWGLFSIDGVKVVEKGGRR